MTAETRLLIRALVELSYVESSAIEARARGIIKPEYYSMFASGEGGDIVETGMKLLGLKNLGEDEIERVLSSPAAISPIQATESDAARKDK